MTTSLNPEKPEPKVSHIQIDRAQYEVTDEKLSGVELRHLPPTPIAPERDLFQIIPGHPDLKIKDDDTVQIQDGLRFFTAPGTINPGFGPAAHESSQGLT